MKIRDLTLSDFDAVNDIFKQLHKLHVEHRPDIYREVENPAEANGYIAEKALLYREAVKRAKERGAEVIQLIVSEFNKTAIDFYKSLGMTVWEYKMEQRI